MDELRRAGRLSPAAQAVVLAFVLANGLAPAVRSAQAAEKPGLFPTETDIGRARAGGRLPEPPQGRKAAAGNASNGQKLHP